jgi:hypothetical protein
MKRDGITKRVPMEMITNATDTGWHINIPKKKYTPVEFKRPADGINNNNAKTINIIDNNGNIVHICTGNFKYICKENDLPFYLLRSTMYKNNTISMASKYINYRGWCARLSV